MEFISLIISGVALFIAMIGIWQTERINKINSNQFVFKKRLEMINLFNAVVNLKEKLHYENLRDDEDYYCGSDWERKKEELIRNIKEEFFYAIEDVRFYELGSLAKATDQEELEKERIKFLLFKSELNENINSIDYIFTNDQLKERLKSVLTAYINVLDQFNTMFFSELQIKIGGIN